MDERTKRRVKLVVGLFVIVAVAIFAWWRKGETERKVKAIAYGTPVEQREALQWLIKKKKAPEALTGRHRWVMENAAPTAAELGSDEAIFEYLATQPKFDAPVGPRSEMVYNAYGELLLPILTGAIQDKDAGRRAATRVKYKLVEADAAIPALMGPIHYSQKPRHTADYKFRLAGAWDDYVRTEVAVSMSQMPPDACYPLIDIHGLLEPPPHISPAQFLRMKSTASDGLKRMAADAFDPIIDTMLELDNAEARAEGTRLLGAIADQTVLPPAAPLADEDAERVVEPLVEILESDPEWTVQRRAAASLGLLALSRQKLEDDEEMTVAVIRKKCLAIQGGALRPLISSLSHRRPEVRAAAAQALGMLRDPIAARPLVNALVSRRHGAAAEIGTALERLGTPSIQPLVPALAHPEDEVRLIATRTIAAVGGREAVQPLGGQLADTSVLVRRAAARALKNIFKLEKDPSVVPQLRAALNDGDWRVYGDARDALTNLGVAGVPALVEALGAEDIRVAFTAQQGLTAVGGDAVPLLLAALGGDTQTSQWSAVALGDMGPDVAAPVTRAMLDPAQPARARASAAEALGRTGFQGGVPDLLKAMKDPDPGVRGAAAKALGRLGQADATDALIAALLDDDEGVQDAALDALEHWTDAKAKEALNDLALNAPNPKHQRLAAVAIVLQFLGGLQGEVQASVVDVGEMGAHVKVLADAAADLTERRRIRELAISGLGYVGHQDELAALDKLIRPGSPYAVRAAVAVARIGDRLKPELSPGQVPPPGLATPILLDSLLQSEAENVRLAAAAGLTVLGEISAQPMIDALETATGDDRQWLIAALAANGKPAVNAMLETRGNARRENQVDMWKALDTALLLTGNAQARDVIDAQPLPEEDQPSEEFYEATQDLSITIRQSRRLEG